MVWIALHCMMTKKHHRNVKMSHLCFRLHFGIDCIIFIQNILITLIIIATVPQWSETVFTFIWLSYLCGILLKIVFYFVFHPWSELNRADLKKTFKSIKNSNEDVEWSICSGTKWMKCTMTCGYCKCRKKRAALFNDLETIENGENYELLEKSKNTTETMLGRESKNDL